MQSNSGIASPFTTSNVLQANLKQKKAKFMQKIIVKPAFIQTSSRCKGFHRRKAYRKISRARFESLEGIKWKKFMTRLMES